MANEQPVTDPHAPNADALVAPVIRAFSIKRFRGIRELTWRPGKGLNVILGGGDVGKTSILEAIALLLSPTNAFGVSDTDYFMRDVDAEFSIEGVFTLPPESGINHQLKPSWPWTSSGPSSATAQRTATSAASGSRTTRFFSSCVRVWSSTRMTAASAPGRMFRCR